MNILETLQRIAATTQRLDMALTQIDRERAERERLEAVIIARLERLEANLSEVRERLVRLDTSREADRAQMAAELARFKAEVERAAFRLTRPTPPQSGPQALPEPEKPENE